MILNSVLEVESFVILLLIIVSVVAIAVNRLRIPYTVALVLVGLALTINQSFSAEVTPELILALFIPPIAFEAALHLESRFLTNDLVQIGGLAIFGVVITTIVIGGTVTLLSR